MTSKDDQTKFQEKRGYFIKKSASPNLLLHRLPVLLLLIYYVWILFSAWSMVGFWSWSPDGGLEWSSGGPGSFVPVPSEPGHLMYISKGYLVDQVFYLVFMHSGIWALWIILGILYLFSPYRLEKSTVCSLLKRGIVIEIVFFLLGAILVTNIHPYWMQVSVYGAGFMLLLTLIVWLITCKR
jgi:hypothetical protein